jgi:hypothetical protein
LFQILRGAHLFIPYDILQVIQLESVNQFLNYIKDKIEVIL